MTVDEALDEAGGIAAGKDLSERTARAAMILAAEVRRYRAAVEEVKALRVRDPIAYALGIEVVAILEGKK